MKSADLHLHTVASDGTDTIEERIRQAEERDIDGIAITDHDTIDPGLEDRSYVADNGVEVITGAEINCNINGTDVEVLAYFLDPDDKEIQRTLDTLEDFRRVRMEEMIHRVNSSVESLDQDLAFQDVKRYADGPVGRPHLAQALEYRGAVDTVDEAFADIIGEDCYSYVPTEKLSARDVISKIHANGGVASLAHPGRDLNIENADEKVKALKEAGLDAIEGPYTYQTKEALGYGVKFGVQHAMQLQNKYDLIVSGGSDCHGSDSEKFEIGSIGLRYNHVEKLRERSKIYSDDSF